MQEQDYIRNSINAYMERIGCTARFICRQVGLDEGEFSKYRRGLWYLSEEKFESLKRYLNQQ